MAIKSFLHSGLEKFAKEGCVAGIGGTHVSKLNFLLAQLSLSGRTFGILHQNTLG